MDAGEEVSGGLVIAGGNRPVPLELTKEILHEVARLVQLLVVEALNLSINFGRNDELFSCREQRLDDALTRCRPASGAEACRRLADHELAPRKMVRGLPRASTMAWIFGAQSAFALRRLFLAPALY
jgi:hypothetical protein